MNILREKMIWNGCEDKNQYVDFFATFKTTTHEKIVVNISCDNIFTFYVNGVTAGFGSCQNFPSEKQYYTFDVTGFTDFSGRENNLKITVWHQGEDSQTYINLPPYLMFNVMQGEIVLARSGEDVRRLAAVQPAGKDIAFELFLRELVQKVGLVFAAVFCL